MQRKFLIALALLPLSAAHAADCSNALTQLDMNQCAAAEYRNADAELNKTYQRALKATEGEQTALLRNAQRTWMAFRDSDCKFQTYATRDGSVNTMNVSACLTSKTQQRTKELKEMLSCPEGDVSCAL